LKYYFSSSQGWGVEKASQALIDRVGSKRDLFIAKKGSDDLKFLDMSGAEAAAGGPTLTSIIVREDTSKAALLEEFLHGTQHGVGVTKRLGGLGTDAATTSAIEGHVKDFMIRHQKLLGLSPADVNILEILKKAGL
jgi:hypothetical protein